MAGGAMCEICPVTTWLKAKALEQGVASVVCEKGSIVVTKENPDKSQGAPKFIVAQKLNITELGYTSNY